MLFSLKKYVVLVIFITSSKNLEFSNSFFFFAIIYDFWSDDFLRKKVKKLS